MDTPGNPDTHPSSSPANSPAQANVGPLQGPASGTLERSPSGHDHRPVGRDFRPSDRWAMAAAFVALVAVGRMITPQASNASEPVDTSRSLGELRGPALTVQMFTHAGVTTYTVRDQHGAILADQIGATELASRFPSLDLRTIHAGRLMLADPDD